MPTEALSQKPLPPARWLNAAEAAAYTGVGLSDFLQEVAAGTWPEPVRRTASAGDLWDRKALDAASDRLSGLDPASQIALAQASMQLLDVAQAAAVLRCSRDTVYRIPVGELPVYRPGKVNLYQLEDVLRYAASKKRARPGIAQAQIDCALQRVRPAA